MSSANSKPHSTTSLERLAHIPLVSASIDSLDTTLSSTPVLRTAYNLCLSVSSHLKPYISSASAHFPFAPVLLYGDRAANKTLDIAQEKWPYPFKTKPEQVWNDLRAVTEQRVVQPACSVAKSVDNSLTPLVNSFSFVVNKIDAHADEKTHPSPGDYQLKRAFALLLVLKDDILSNANTDKNPIIRNIHAIAAVFTRQSAALRSRFEDAGSHIQDLTHAVLNELTHLISSFISNTFNTVKRTTSSLCAILRSDDTVGQKIPKFYVTIKDGVGFVAVDIGEKLHEFVDDLRSSSPSASSSSNTPSNNVAHGPKRNKKLMAQTNGITTSPANKTK